MLGHPHSEEVFPDVQMELPGFQFVLTACGSVTGPTEKSLPCSSLHYCTLYLDTLISSCCPPVPTLFFFWYEVPSASAEAGVSTSTKKCWHFPHFQVIGSSLCHPTQQTHSKALQRSEELRLLKTSEMAATVPRQTWNPWGPDRGLGKWMTGTDWKDSGYENKYASCFSHPHRNLKV